MKAENVSLTTSQDNTTRLPCPSIDEFRSQVYPPVYSVITVFGLLGNGLAVSMLIRTAQQGSVFNVYMLNLAVSDMLCVSTLPLRIIYYVRKSHWEYGDFLCRVSAYAFYVNLYSSIFFMTAVSLSRFLAIVFPVRSLRWLNVCKARIISACIWLFICIVHWPFLRLGTYLDPITNKTKCLEPPDDKRNINKFILFNYFSLVVYLAIPLLVILPCYAGIIHTLMFKPSAMKKGARAKAVAMIIIVILAFFISFLPYHVQRTVHLLSLKGQNCDEIAFMQKSVVVTLCLAASNSCFDPLLYFFSGENVRRQVLSFKRNSKAQPDVKLPLRPSSFLTS
ncbi:hypothetical protein GJAV_G00130450 [Gymnothorax javanicus]|nr:hypothetical protein GJAV_G00130450 [Gymnothorax javanicus]